MAEHVDTSRDCEGVRPEDALQDSGAVNVLRVSLVFFLLQLVLLISPPASQGFDIAVASQAAGFILIGMWGIRALSRGSIIDQRESLILPLMCTWALYILLRGLVDSLTQQASFIGLLRQTTPLVVPLLVCAPWGFVRRGPYFTRLLIQSAFLGLVQLAIMLWIQFTRGEAQTGQEAAVGRITLLDPRTTQTAIVPLFALSAAGLMLLRSTRARVAAGLLGSIALLISLATLMRSMFLIYGVQLVVAASILARSAGFSGVVSRMITPSIIAILLIIPILATVPRFSASVDAFSQRVQTTELGEGRTEGEWDIAIAEYWRASESSLVIMCFGLGPEFSFESSEGDRRAYLHNSLLYWLVFYGLVGVILGILLVGWTTFRLLQACHDARFEAVFVACVWIGLWTYAQVFAVHKLVLFNLQVGMILVIAVQGIFDDNRFSSNKRRRGRRGCDSPVEVGGRNL